MRSLPLSSRMGVFQISISYVPKLIQDISGCKQHSQHIHSQRIPRLFTQVVVNLDVPWNSLEGQHLFPTSNLTYRQIASRIWPQILHGNSHQLTPGTKLNHIKNISFAPLSEGNMWRLQAFDCATWVIQGVRGNMWFVVVLRQGLFVIWYSKTCGCNRKLLTPPYKFYMDGAVSKQTADVMFNDRALPWVWWWSGQLLPNVYSRSLANLETRSSLAVQSTTTQNKDLISR